MYLSAYIATHTNFVCRELDEKATIQRAREEEAIAKLAAKKAGVRMPERPAAPTSSESSDRPTSGPPRLALAGSKPTWRDRQAQKEAEAASGNTPAPPAAPPSDIATAEAQLPKKTGYVPPARRAPDAAPRGRTDAQPSSAPREESSGGDAPAKWRPSGPRNGAGRDDSPAESPAPKFLAPGRRADGAGRDQSPADGAAPTKYMPRFQRDGKAGDAPPARTESPAAEAKLAPGKYVPVHLRNRR